MQVSNLIKDNHQLTERLDEVECRAREDTLVVTGPNVPSASAQENVNESVIRLCRSTLKCELKNEDILNAYRIGKSSTSQKPDKRSILIRLRTKGIRDDLLFSAKKKFNPSGLFVNENLTQSRANILCNLRKTKRLFPTKIGA